MRTVPSAWWIVLSMLPGSAGADLPEPARQPADERDVREGLDILDERSAPPTPRSKTRGGPSRQGQTAVEQVDDGRFLAGQETRGCSREADRHPVDAGRPALAQGVLQGRRELVALGLVHVPAGFRAPTASAASWRPSSTRCGASHSRDASLPAAGLTLRAVGDDDTPATRPGDRFELPVHGEGRAAAAGQPGGPQVGGQVQAARPGRGRSRAGRGARGALPAPPVPAGSSRGRPSGRDLGAVCSPRRRGMVGTLIRDLLSRVGGRGPRRLTGRAGLRGVRGR